LGGASAAAQPLAIACRRGSRHTGGRIPLPAPDLARHLERGAFGGTYAITDNIAYYVDIKNITNTKLEFMQTSDTNFLVQREFYDTDFLTGICVKF
jgi:hypothetical protein